MGFNKIIYTLSHPSTGYPFYVGASQNIYLRLTQHINSPSPDVKPILDELRSKNLSPVIEEIDRGDSATEMYWIQQLFVWGYPLVNINGRLDMGKGYTCRERKQFRSNDSELKFWASIKETEDVILLAKHIGVREHHVKSAIKTGFCYSNTYNTIKDYFENKIQIQKVEDENLLQLIKETEDLLIISVPPLEYNICEVCDNALPVTLFSSYKGWCCADCKGSKAHKTLRYYKSYLKTKSAGLVSQKRWNDANKERIKEYMATYRKHYKHPDPLKRAQTIKKSHDKRKNNAVDGYVKRLIHKDEVTPEMIELRRQQLLIKRQIKELIKKSA